MKARIHALAGIALGFTAVLAHAEESRWLTPTMIEARANMMNPGLNYLTFQHMNQMFATRTTAAGDRVWPLETSAADIGDSFKFEGRDLSLKDFLEATATNALVVLKDGKIVYEEYRNTSSPETRFMSYSMAKSILATMVGLAVEDGKIKSLDDRVVDYLPDWEGTAYANVKIIDLLHMRSGIDWLEVYEFGSDTQLTKVHDGSLVGYKFRWCDYAKDNAKTGVEPGSAFNYSTLDTSVLGCVLEKAVGMKGANYLSEKIWQPAGMEADGYYILDGTEEVGREFFGAGFNARARDFARFGLMMLNGGKANGEQVVPASWVQASTAPAPENEPEKGSGELGYGYQWWTIPGTSSYSAIGLFNQFIFVDPPSKTVIVKLAAPASPLGWEQENLDFFKAVVSKLGQ